MDGAALKNPTERGISLIAMCFFMIATGAFLTAGAKLYGVYESYESIAVTRERTAVIQTAMQNYLSEYGRYPCPASLTEPVDSATFGREISSNCANPGAAAGTFSAPGAATGAGVRTGGVPVRTLGIEDEFMFDGYDRRLIYAVTESYATQGVRGADNGGEISVVDDAGNPSTSEPVSQIIISTGLDDNGAYNINGVSVSACNTGARSGENCDFAANAVYLNSVRRSTNTAAGNAFVHNISYVPPKPIIQCADSNTGDDGKPLNTAFLIDTSGSMLDPGICPVTMPGCNRMDVALWAMRRVMPATVYNSSRMETPGIASMTGFVARGSTTGVRSAIAAAGIDFYDPAQLDEDADSDGIANRDEMDEFLTDMGATLETELQGMCPGGSTPLGSHIDALASHVGNGTETRPNKIIVISDGYSNNGESPYDVAARLAVSHPYVQVDIVDVVGNPGLRAISESTGGKYYSSSNPDELLADLLDSAGLCNAYVPPAVSDQPSCGSSASGWPAAGL